MVGTSCPSCSYHAPVHGYSIHFYSPCLHQAPRIVILPYASADILSHFSQTWQNTILLLSLWIVSKRRNRKTFDSEDLDTGSTLRLFGDHLKLWSSQAPKGQPSDHALAWCQQLVE